ncbi:hypothetical protein BH10PSE15_BH10PSE15_06790 [soil metagenome]
MPRRRTRTRRGRTRAEWVRVGVLTGVAVLAGAGITAVDLAADASVIPEVASRIDPDNSDALTGMAEITAKDDLDVAHRYARAAIARNPLDDRALLVAALAHTSINDVAGADRLFALITRITRRQALAETWMFDVAANHGDFAGAVDHADAALRRHTADGDILPVLIRITDTSAALPALARKLAAQPPWRPAFFRAFAASKDGNAVALIDALHQARGRAAPIEVAAMASQAIAAGSTANARTVWLKGFGSPLPPLLSPTFESLTQYGDFGWAIGARGAAQIVARLDDRGHALEVPPSTTGKRPLRVVQQAMLLDRGRHVITFEGRGVGGTRSAASVVVRCAGTDAVLGQALVPSGRSWAPGGYSFIVPPTECPIQKLVIEAVPNFVEGMTPTLIDNFRVE